MVGGDEATADNLVEYGRERMPGASTSELIESAVPRLVRDRQ